jgi:hypothetical protein
VYVPHDTSKKGLPKNSRGARTYRHEEGAHYLYFYAPFSAWMIGSRPGSGSAALIAYDGAERPDLIARDAPWRVYDGRAWREVADVRIRALADQSGKSTPETQPCAATLEDFARVCLDAERLHLHEVVRGGVGPQRSHGAALFVKTVLGLLVLRG